jgi:hypothetical protein
VSLIIGLFSPPLGGGHDVSASHLALVQET